MTSVLSRGLEGTVCEGTVSCRTLMGDTMEGGPQRHR